MLVPQKNKNALSCCVENRFKGGKGRIKETTQEVIAMIQESNDGCLNLEPRYQQRM